MNLITWNVQWCCGVDGVVDPLRIIRTARAIADFDVLCLQEVARNYPGLSGSTGEDQFGILEAALPGFTAVEGIATDVLGEAGRRRQFGNLILTRRPVLQIFRHLLPWPADPTVPSMQRCAIEIVIGTASGPLRVTTTHLEYYSLTQRTAQVAALCDLQREAALHGADPVNREKAGGPFQKQPRPASGILTADFNFRPDSACYRAMQAPLGGAAPSYRDAWKVRHPNAEHAPTLGLFDKGQWPGDPFCCDFIFVTEDLCDRVIDVAVNERTDASDHQPVLLQLRD
ncbi:MAG: endonuclease [Betaproteobacteria bacterium]|nr:endonuclease [Betaproteobacteria bacterium]